MKTKMIYQIKHTNHKQNFFGRNVKALAVFLLIIIVVFIFSASNPLNSFVTNIFSPLLKFGGHFYEIVFQVPQSFSDKNKILEENKTLLQQMENMRISLIDHEFIKSENDRLRQELGLRPAGKIIGAEVIAKYPQIPLDSLLIDRGATDSLNNGDLVLVGERVLIGKVAKVSKNMATVVLSSFPDVVSYVYVERTNEPLEIKGIGGGSMQARVPIDFDIAVGDKILLQSSRAYITAVVGAVEENHQSGFKNVLMSLPTNIAKTGVVFIEPLINE